MEKQERCIMSDNEWMTTINGRQREKLEEVDYELLLLNTSQRTQKKITYKELSVSDGQRQVDFYQLLNQFEDCKRIVKK